ncbi:MAG: Peptidyl-prolyl cis-trans isomerase [Parcubacteria group bacterium GW2011_GWA2_47_21]|nr:MAG: Peptidyl-prolyl cis-trans isomerase [Parcubacteria group bacterium GW2011_GWA2_47_21]
MFADKRDLRKFHVFAVVILAFALGLVWYINRTGAKLADPIKAENLKIVKNSYEGAVLHTSEGEIEIVFLRNLATTTVINFAKLAASNFYAGTKFHRVIPNFMIQGGDPLSKGEDRRLYGTGDPGYFFKDEINGEEFIKGVAAMANRGPDTNGSQFFIVTAPAAPWLAGKHTIFAKVIRGMDVAERISNASRDKNDVPLIPIIIENVVLK